jgi:hypothetical protein
VKDSRTSKSSRKFVRARDKLITEFDRVHLLVENPTIIFSTTTAIQINGNMSAFQNGGIASRALDDDSDIEEEALANDYKEQVQYEGMEELEQVNSMSMAQQADDIQSRLAAAAQPLDFSASLEVKFASYDNYCSLFHFILNSDGPVDLEPPSVRIFLPL